MWWTHLCRIMLTIFRLLAHYIICNPVDYNIDSIAQSFCEICQESWNHSTKNCPYNMRNKKSKWCMICEENEHDTTECSLNLRNKMNYQVYQVQSTNRNQQPQRNFQRNNYKNNNRRGGFWWRRNSNQGNHQSGKQRQKPRFYTYLKADHLFQDCPWKDKTDLKFCGNCGVGEHSLEDCLVMLVKIMNKRNIKSLSSFDNDNDVKCANVNVITRNCTDTNNVKILKFKVNNQGHPDVSRQK